MKSTADALKSHLDGTIEWAYHVFARYESTPPLAVHCCPYCVKSDDQQLLFSRPLRDLMWAELEYYGFKAVHSWGSVDDFKHFLPRVLQLFALEAPCRYDRPTVSGKLRHARWTEWPEDEKRAVVTFFNAWWQWRLAMDPDNRIEISELVMILGTVFDDLLPFLRYWDSQLPQSLAAAQQLASFIENNTWSGDPYHLGCVWGSNEAHLRTIANWLFEPRKAEFVAAAYDDESRTSYGILNLDQLAAYHTMCANFVSRTNS